MTAKPDITTDDLQLCQDIAKADLSIVEIGNAHKMSASNVYKIARGDVRPELKAIIDELVDAEHGAAKRLARSRGRWFMARLIQLAKDSSDDTALKAVVKGLEIAGLADLDEYKDVRKQAIEIILSSGNGKAEPNSRLSGIYNINGGEN